MLLPPRERLPAVDFLRAFCILTVMGHHFADGISPRPSFGSETFSSLFANGPFGVTGFFVVSGFLITRLLGPGESPLPLKQFYVRRAARILPLFLLSVALGLLLHAALSPAVPGGDFCLFGRGWALTPLYLASAATFTANWYLLLDPYVFRPVFWSALWSLSVEEQFYLVYPFFHHRWAGSRRLFFALVFAVAAGVLFRLGCYFHDPVNALLSYVSTFSALDALGLGALSFLLWDKIRDSLRAAPGASSLLAILGWLLSLYAYLSASRPADRVLAPFLLALGCALFLVGGCSLPDRWFRPFHPWISLGSLSYGLYLLHTLPLLVLWKTYRSLPVLPAFALFVGLSWFLAACSHRFFEKPVNRLVRRWFGVAT